MYQFEERSSRNAELDGETVRVVSYRATDNSPNRYESMDMTGSFTMDLIDYFMAGAEQRLEEEIRSHVLEKISKVNDDEVESEPEVE